MALMEVFEPDEMFQGTGWSYQRGQAMSKFKEAERQDQGGEKENGRGSLMLERNDGRQARGQP